MAAIPQAGTGPTGASGPAGGHPAGELWLARPAGQEGPVFRQRPLERSVRDALLAQAGAARGIAGPGAALSHSGSWVACGAGTDLAAGVDMEWLRPRAVLRLARFSYSADEADWLAALPVAQRVAAFHELWVLKEAAAKVLRLPLFTALAQCRFRLEEGRASGALPGGLPWRAWVYAPREALRLAWLSLAPEAPAPRTLEWQVGEAAARPAGWPVVASGSG
jgi:hypothetical protein